MLNRSFRHFIYIMFFTFFISSCVTSRQAIYFNNVQDKDFIDVEIVPVIQNSDLLSITVSSLNPQATIIFNAPNQSGATGSTTTGYLVNTDGDILFPVLGPVKAAGLTQKELMNNLANTLVQKKLLVDPIVNVRIQNFKVTVLGEVSSPSVIPVPSEKISLLEALGAAGDMTLYAQRDNVLLVRVENGKKITRRINLNTSDFFTSPYYYLKSNDVVYVEPNKVRLGSTTRTQQLLPTVFSAISLALIIITQIIFKN